MSEQDRVPQHVVDRANEDIVGVIRGYVPELKKAGKDWKACCPFHDEKTPSFTVSESKGFFWCYGCGAGKDLGNDAIGFVRAITGMSMRDAIKSILGELTLESSSVPRKKIIRAYHPGDLPSHAEDRQKAIDIMSRTNTIERHTYLMRNNTSSNTPVSVNGKGILMVPLVNNIGETVNVAAILTSGAITYAAGNPSFGSTAILEPTSEAEFDGKTIICADYAHAWRIWWSQLGKSRVLCAMEADNLNWMLANCKDRFTHVGCDPVDVDEHAEMGRGVIAIPIDPYAKLDRKTAAA